MAMSVTVRSLEELRSAVEERSAEEGVHLRVSVSGVRINEAAEALAVLRRQVSSLRWRVDEGATAALEAAADSCARMEAVVSAVDGIARDMEAGIPIAFEGPRIRTLQKAATEFTRRPSPFLRYQFALNAVDAQDVGRVAESLSVGGRARLPEEEVLRRMALLVQRADRTKARIHAFLATTIPADYCPDSLSDSTTSL